MTTLDTLAAQLGAALAAAREASGKTQRGQARDLGIASTTLRELELGHANPTLGRVEALADALDLTVTLTVTPNQ